VVVAAAGAVSASVARPGPVRYWQDRGRVAAKCALAAMAAWALARYAAGQPDPYFAPLAALLGVSPTVARSMREGLQYVAGFALGAVLAIPVALVLGPSIAGVAVVVLAGVVIGSWRHQSLILLRHDPHGWLASRSQAWAPIWMASQGLPRGGV
jgi:hypothetical protein